jgi:hypothetical protein
MKKLFLLLFTFGIFAIPNISFASDLYTTPGFQEITVGQDPAYISIYLTNTDIEYLVKAETSINIWPADLIESFEVHLPLGLSRYKYQETTESTHRDGIKYLNITEYLNFPDKIGHDNTKKIFHITIVPKGEGRIYVGDTFGMALGFSNIMEESGDEFPVMLSQPFRGAGDSAIQIEPKKMLMVLPPMGTTDILVPGFTPLEVVEEESGVLEIPPIAEPEIEPIEPEVKSGLLGWVGSLFGDDEDTSEAEEPAIEEIEDEITEEEPVHTEEILTEDETIESPSSIINTSEKTEIQPTRNLIKDQIKKQTNPSFVNNPMIPWALLGGIIIILLLVLIFKKKS